MSETPRRTTPHAPAEMASAMLEALQNRHIEATAEQAARLWAHNMTESGRGSKMSNNNPGNLSANPNTYRGDWYRPIWFDLSKLNASERSKYEPLHQKMLDGRAPSAFRSYGSVRAGIEDYLKLLQSARMLPILKEAKESGLAMAAAVYNQGYCQDANCRPEVLGPTLDSISKQGLSAGYFDSLPKAQAVAVGRPLPPSQRPLCSLPELRSGSQGDAVALWQALMNVECKTRDDSKMPTWPDCLVLAADGVFGFKTRSVTVIYQAREGLLPDGVVGPKTWKSIWSK